MKWLGGDCLDKLLLNELLVDEYATKNLKRLKSTAS